MTNSSPGVESTFEYVSPHSKVNLRYSGGGGEVNTGIFDRHKMFVRNARLEPDLSLKTCGFELVHHTSDVDFYDGKDVEARYPAEVERVLKDTSGADHVVVFGALRRNVAKPEGRVWNAATDVHVDYEAAHAREVARSLLGIDKHETIPYRRYMAINLWRALSPPPQDQPLAVCDARSVVTQSGAPPPRAEMLKAPPPNDAELPHGWIFHFDPAHRWYYYPDMTRDELLLFKLYDSIESGPWRCPHASFVDPTVPADTPPRESYEIRSFVYFR
jgi:hypothetical protein